MSDAPSTPTPPPRKRPRLGAHTVCAATLTESTLLAWTKQDLSLYQNPVWRHLTHVVVPGLVADATGAVVPHKMMDVWFPVLQELRRLYPHLKLVLSIAPLTVLDILQLVWDEQMLTFFQSWKTCLDTYQADGTYLPLEHVQRVPESFAGLLASFAYRRSTWIGIPNQAIRIMERWGRETFERIQEHCQLMVMMCYNYLEYDRVITERGVVGFLKASMESAYLPFQQCLEQAPFIHTPKLLMQLDTCGLHYHHVQEETQHAQHVTAVPYHEIQRLRKVGVTIGQRLYRYKEITDPIAQASALFLPKNHDWITYDSYRIRNTKLNGMVHKKMRGVVLGDLGHDMPVIHPDSIVRMAYQKCEPRGLDVSLNQLAQQETA